MDVTEKDRLLKLIGMLGSTFDNERAVAAAKIGEMAQRHKLTINELIAQAHGSKVETQRQRWKQPHREPPEQPEHDPFGGFKTKPGEGENSILSSLRRLWQTQGIPLTDWESGFVSDVSRRYQFDYELSIKQMQMIDKIFKKATRYGWKNR